MTMKLTILFQQIKKENKKVQIVILMKLFFHLTLGAESYFMMRKKEKIKIVKLILYLREKVWKDTQNVSNI